jgi:cytochrome b pre-mRNA-processing protein 3
MLKTLLKARESRELGREFCAAIGARAREPVFFTNLGVPDTIDGRFDLVLLHAWLVLDRLRVLEMKDVSQTLVNALFESFDESLRELGVGDIGIGHRVKKMADAFYGRLAAYGEAVGEDGLREAVLRNVYRGELEHAADALILAQYSETARARLAENDMSGDPDFGPLPSTR